MLAKKLGEKKLYARIASQIRTMIEAGDLPPGAKLPPLASLANQFGCSRATVREALSSLRGQGLIEFRHGDGTYVRCATVDMWMEPLEAAILLGVNQVEQLVELEMSILAGVASRAARLFPDIDVRALSYALFQLECTEGYGEQAIAAEIIFYLTLAECADNPLLENTLRVLQEALRSSLRAMNLDSGFGLALCQTIFHSIQMNDEVRAREAVYQYGTQIIEKVKERRAPS